MINLSKSVYAILAAILVASMAFQVCCHQDWSEFSGHEHHKESSEHSSHSHDHSKNASSKDECGPHKFTDLVKSDKINVTNSPSVSSFTIPFQDRVINELAPLLKKVSFRLGYFNKAGPPIHLLNSVFLN